MKTKTFLLAGLVCAASALASVAQTVYSVNAVGFVNTVLPSGFSMISNPLNGATNTITALFQGAPVPNGSKVYKFNPGTGGFAANSFLFGNWSDTTMTLLPGEGVFFKNNGVAFTNTFVGNVPAGALTNAIPSGFSIVSSQVPQQGLVDTDLLFPAANGDALFFFNNGTGNYDRYGFLFGSWAGPGGSTTAPLVAVGQAFWVKKSVAVNWVRTFSIAN